MSERRGAECLLYFEVVIRSTPPCPPPRAAEKLSCVSKKVPYCSQSVRHVEDDDRTLSWGEVEGEAAATRGLGWRSGK